MNALRHVDPMLAVRFRDAPPPKRRTAARVACERAAAAVGLEGPELADALGALRAGAVPDLPLSRRVQALAARLSDASLEAGGSGDAAGAPDSGRQFARSCVASAVALAVAGDDAQAIYEALHAVDQPNDLPQVVIEALR